MALSLLLMLIVYIAIFLLSFQWKQRGLIWGFRICRISKKSKLWWNFRKSFLYFFSYPVVWDQKGLFITFSIPNKTRDLIFTAFMPMKQLQTCLNEGVWDREGSDDCQRIVNTDYSIPNAEVLISRWHCRLFWHLRYPWISSTRKRAY